MLDPVQRTENGTQDTVAKCTPQFIDQFNFI
jgi:hypothetical protein